MSEAIIGLVSAFGVVIIKGIFDYVMQRRKRKDELEDADTKETEKILDAIESVKTEMKSEIEEVRVEIRETKSDMKKLSDRQERSEIIQCRVRFMRFADEIIHKEPRHSRDHYEQTMDDITVYLTYCKQHPDFKNDITEASIELIRESYKERLQKNDFL